MDYMRKKVRVTGVRVDIQELVGSWVFIDIMFGLVATLGYVLLIHGLSAPWKIIDYVAAVEFFFIGFVVAIIALELSMYYAMRNRTSDMEKVLPDYLLLIASNMRAGMTPFTAFVRAARPEFGALSKEVILAASKLSGTASLNDALDELATRFDSMILERAVVFFKKGVRSGGQIAALLVASAEEIRKIQDLRAELIVATKTYSIFLGFIVIIIMPFLLSLSTHFIEMFLTIREQTIGSTDNLSRSIPMFGGNILVTPDEMTSLAYLSLLITGVLISALVGIIIKGRALDGVKYFPVFAIASLIMFTLSKLVIGSMLSGVV
jgi:hypothetical protein